MCSHVPNKVVRVTQNDNVVDIFLMKVKLSFDRKMLMQQIKSTEGHAGRVDKGSPGEMCREYTHNPNDVGQVRKNV